MNGHVIQLVLIAFIIKSVVSLKLLIVFPAGARSHYNLGNALGKGLANLGHEVTLVAPFSEPNPPKNFKEIVFEDVLKKYIDADKSLNLFDASHVSPFLYLFILNYFSSLMMEGFFKANETQDLLRSNETYDVVIVEQFLSDSLHALAEHFNAKLVVFSTVGSNTWTNNLVANPSPLSYVPDIFLGFSSDMTLLQRAYNLLFSIVAQLNLHFIAYPKQADLVRKYIPNAPDFTKIHYNVSLILLNSHESISQPVPYVPNMISIGGYHVNPPKQLPKDLQEFMDESKEGVIYFSMGSNLKPSQLPNRTKEIILKVLGSRKERVLWKWDEDQLKDQPRNVKISKWFPQQGILAHPNCKLFISHGGFLSTIETVTMGVPILALPVFGDQRLNAARAVALGFGNSLSFVTLSEEEFSSKLEELISNPKYRENVKLRSELIRDRPMKPIELADYWIRYVVKYNGAPHLRVAGINLPFYQYWLLDVIAVYLGGFILMMYLLKTLYRYMSKSNKQGKLSKKKKQ
ncbi:hypothetical protein GWI33_019986 [Rhynchophorus ferrugineus]|uniref:UDP-glucuronosyltransferase n=1 Tax=Rhynchophorus ferrugineus TaxID=354439 RepID=A0A834M0W3_RHYFE|nr:hypothetical protein GWI33_019986 [Rhynchophorus ferrugineus]